MGPEEPQLSPSPAAGSLLAATDAQPARSPNHAQNLLVFFLELRQRALRWGSRRLQSPLVLPGRVQAIPLSSLLACALRVAGSPIGSSGIQHFVCFVFSSLFLLRGIPNYSICRLWLSRGNLKLGGLVGASGIQIERHVETVFVIVSLRVLQSDLWSLKCDLPSFSTDPWDPDRRPYFQCI